MTPRTDAPEGPSLRRLADAAEAFGRGETVPRFKPHGAREVRAAATAFLAMRDRIQRHIDQRTALLASVSHDLRTPLTGMGVTAELLERLLADEPPILDGAVPDEAGGDAGGLPEDLPPNHEER